MKNIKYTYLDNDIADLLVTFFIPDPKHKTNIMVNRMRKIYPGRVSTYFFCNKLLFILIHIDMMKNLLIPHCI